jgi:hypothetical protein
MRHIFRRIGVLLLAVLSSLFAFTTNDFWLNLHHYLYVLGRAHSRVPDAMQLGLRSPMFYPKGKMLNGATSSLSIALPTRVDAGGSTIDVCAAID